MSIDRQDLEQPCQQTLAETDFKGSGSRFVGKVRDSYVGATPGERTIVASHRVSGMRFDPNLEEPVARIRRNLSLE